MDKDNAIIRVYVGTYTKNESKGIYTFLFNTNSGEITNIKLACNANNPTYLCMSNNSNRLYSIIKNKEFGGIASYIINKNGSLELLNYKISLGNPPCYLTFSNDHNIVFSANYHTAVFSAFNTNGNGELNIPLCSINHNHLNKSHLHCCTIDNNNKVYVTDLGLDKISIYDIKNNNIILNSNNSFSIPSGYGPRHLIFSSDYRYAYIICEVSSRILVFNCYNKITNIQDISTLPIDFSGESYASAIKLSNDGEFLYASNRGHDSIACYKVNKIDGSLTLLGHNSTLGNCPRDFEIDPTNKFLIVANQTSNNLTVFKIKNDGLLDLISNNIKIPEPTCLKFFN